MRRSLLLGRPWIGGWKLVPLLSVGCCRGDGVHSLGKCRGEVLSEGGLQARLQRELFYTYEGMTWLVTLCSRPRSKFLGFLRASGLGRGRHHLRAFVVCMCPNEQQRASWKGFRRKSVSLVLSICICASVGQQLTEQVVPASSQKGPMRPTLEVAVCPSTTGGKQLGHGGSTLQIYILATSLSFSPDLPGHRRSYLRTTPSSTCPPMHVRLVSSPTHACPPLPMLAANPLLTSTMAGGPRPPLSVVDPAGQAATCPAASRDPGATRRRLQEKLEDLGGEQVESAWITGSRMVGSRAGAP